MRVLVVPLFFYVSLIDTLPSESFQGTHHISILSSTENFIPRSKEYPFFVMYVYILTCIFLGYKNIRSLDKRKNNDVTISRSCIILNIQSLNHKFIYAILYFTFADQLFNLL